MKIKGIQKKIKVTSQTSFQNLLGRCLPWGTPLEPSLLPLPSGCWLPGPALRPVSGDAPDLAPGPLFLFLIYTTTNPLGAP